MSNDKKWLLEIKVDTNDGDYNSTLNEITDDEANAIRRLAKAIKAFKSYESISDRNTKWSHDNNFPYGECCRDDLGEKSPEELYPNLLDELEVFYDNVPMCESGFHTVCKINIYQLSASKEELL